jgi:hypothetical protein
MKNNYCSNILSQLTSAGFSIHKCQQDSVWQIKDEKDVVMQNRALGCLMKKAAQEFKLDWSDV